MEAVCSRNPAIEELFSRENAYYELAKFRIEQYDQIADEIEKLCFMTLISYYENYVITGVHYMH